MFSKNSPTVMFWNFVGLAIAILSVGVSWSLLQASSYKLEAANQKLEVNTAVKKVQKVSDTLEESVESLPIAEPKKQQLKQQLEQADDELTEINQNILSDEDHNQTE